MGSVAKGTHIRGQKDLDIFVLFPESLSNKELEKEQQNKLITEDDRDKGKKQIDDLTKDFSKEIDSIIKTKSDEIMSE